MNDCVEAIILKQSDYRERDVLLTVLTKAYGKLRFTATGARKITSKNASSIIPFTVSRLYFDYDSKRTIFRLRTAEKIQMFRHIHEDLEKSTVASILCECIDSFTFTEEQVAEKEYDLLLMSLQLLENGYPVDTVLSLFIADLLRLFGSSPQVDSCALCNRKTIRAISSKAGGFLCEEHAKQLEVPYSSIDDLKRFRLLCKAGIERIDYVVEHSEATFSDVSILMEFLHTYTGTTIRSFALYRSVIQLNNRL